MPPTGGDGSRTEPAHVDVAAGETANEPLLPSPLQAYRLTPSELTTITYARGLLIDRCMRAAGFSYPQRPFSQELGSMLASERTAIGRRYGIMDPGLAATYGYGFPAGPESGTFASVERDSRYMRALRGSPASPRQEANQRDATGSQEPTGGCVGEADRRLGATDPDVSPFGLAHSLWVEGQQHLIATRQYRTVVGEWAACMSRGGHRVTDPISDRRDIADVFRARRDANDPSLVGSPIGNEVALAVADVRCKQSTRLVDRLDSVSASIDRASIAGHRPTLEEDRRRLARTLALADLLLRNKRLS